MDDSPENGDDALDADERPAAGIDPASVSAEEFDAMVVDELDLLPDDMVDGLDNVVFVTEDRPEDGSLDLLGLYDGVALTERGQYGFGELPDRIILYREPHLAAVDDLDELARRDPRHARPRDRPLLRHRRRPTARARLGLTEAAVTR